MPYRRVNDPVRLQQLLEALLLLERDLDLDDALRHIVEQACSLVSARYGAIGVIEPGTKRLAQFVTVGMTPDEVGRIDHLPRGEGVLGVLIDDPRPLRLSHIKDHPKSVGFPANHPPMDSFLGAPVTVHGEVFGNIYLAEKVDGGAFSEEDNDILEALAIGAGIVVENSRLHAKAGELDVAADRIRIAHDLHDTVIQRLFATGLSLQSAAAGLHDVPPASEAIQTAVQDLDDTIRQVRTSIFALEPLPAGRRGLRARLLDLSAESVRSLGFEPSVSVSGPIDTTVSERVAGNVLAVVREALSNVARHASASHVHIELTVADRRLRLVVADDGAGMSGNSAPGRLGIANMSERAHALGGSFEILGRQPTGTEVRFEVPLRDD